MKKSQNFFVLVLLMCVFGSMVANAETQREVYTAILLDKAEQNDSESLNTLKLLYDKEYVPISEEESFILALARLDSRYQYNLAKFYHKKQTDYYKAAYWLIMAAKSNDALAQNDLGTFYEHGRGLRQNYQKALELYQQAAINGSRTGEHNVGMMFYNGNGVIQDYQQAAKHFFSAAQKESALSQFMLATMYFDGKLPENMVTAHMWANLGAAKMGEENDPLLQKLLNIRTAVEQFLTPAQISYAQKLANECKAKKFKNCGDKMGI